MLTKYLRELVQCVLFGLVVLPISSCAQTEPSVVNTKAFRQMNDTKPDKKPDKTVDTATFAAGCFWCVNAQFSTLKGVRKVVCGFAGGHTPNPTYETVSTGLTGYAETCNIIYDPSVISFPQLLAAFFVAHDPTQLNRQGNDVGTQYRSVIFYHNQHQKQLSEFYIKQLDDVKAYPHKIVTQVVPYTRFYPAGKYHQNYYLKHPKRPYCEFVIQPEMKRFKKVFAMRLKSKP